jgi:hypothetical protein
VGEVADAHWSARYVTGPAGRVLTQGLPGEFSCRVTLNGRELVVDSLACCEIRPWTGPKWVHAENARQTIIWVDTKKRAVEGVELDYWRTTEDPTQFRAYIQDIDARQLIPAVKVSALRSGITTASDANGLFTVEIPASYRKGKTPPAATETLVFSTPGYRRFEYRDLILHPGVNPLEVLLEKGKGTVVRKNRSIHNGNPGEDEFFTFKGSARPAPNGNRGEIISLEIEPSAYEGGWIMCKQPGAKAIVKGRNLKSVEISWFSTGTGIGLYPPAIAGPMKKVRTSPQGDTWELGVPDLMATDFWAHGVDANGKTVRSMNLGNVGWNLEH